ncbi:MAG TPA: glycosyltransferase, partial [Dehalococcoidia bacterium]|nr:glycosyltransferase [Dehalococcoidia bacterium]
MLQSVDVGERSIEAYRGIVPDNTLDELRAQAASLRGARVLHINATPYGGGVSELLRSVVPLQSDLGIIADWRIVSGDRDFFEATKAMHNALQGDPQGLSEGQRQAYVANAQRNADQMQEEYDFVIVHDPQPAALLHLRGHDSARWIWRCHIDTSEPNVDVWSFLRPFLADYDAAVFTLPEFIPPDLPVDLVEVIPPAIDPLSPKNLPLPESLARQILGWIGIELGRPLITQVARFDPWKDPLGVIDAYRLARQSVPNLQLALVGSMALDDPEGWTIYERILEESRSDPMIHVFSNLTGVGNIEVNAFQRLSDVVVQKSLREGFGLVVSEAMWKGTPVVAGRAGGIPLQMADGVGGILVDGVQECADAIVRLLEHPDEGTSLGERGRERVRQHFLLPRLLLNEVSLMNDLLRV